MRHTSATIDTSDAPEAALGRESRRVQSFETPDDPDMAKVLIGLCRTGRLYEVEAWIQAGRPLDVRDRAGRTPLRVAFDSGFHSLLELLLRHHPSQAAKNDILRRALRVPHPEFVRLAVECGADASEVSFTDVLRTSDRTIATFFLERGADPIAGSPFAVAFHEIGAKSTLGTYLDCRRQRPELAAALQAQADMALRQFCVDGNTKWISLMMWVGANPRSRGPTLESAPLDPETYTTALEEACATGKLEVLKPLKLEKGSDDLSALLRSAAYGSPRMIDYLLDLGAHPNDKPNGGSSVLETAITRLGWYSPSWPQEAMAARLTEARQVVRILLERGACWRPETSELTSARRVLYGLDPTITIEVLTLLRQHRACDDSLVQTLLQGSRMRQHLAPYQRQLRGIGVTLTGCKLDTPARPPRPPSPFVLAAYDRDKLYEEVWTEPTCKVAQRYGISDVGLAKVCRQLQIPKPARGYWAKKAARLRVPTRPALRPLGAAADLPRRGR